MSLFDFFDDNSEDAEEYLENINPDDMDEYFNGLELIDLDGDGIPDIASHMGDSVFLDGLNEHIIEAVKRSTNELDDHSGVFEIDQFLEKIEESPEALQGMVNNIKGITGEIEICNHLNLTSDGSIHYELAKYTNNPDVDIIGYDENGEIVKQFQVKMTDDMWEVIRARENLPEDIDILVNSELGDFMPGVYDSGISNEILEDRIEDLFENYVDLDPLDILNQYPEIEEYLNSTENIF